MCFHSIQIKRWNQVKSGGVLQGWVKLWHFDISLIWNDKILLNCKEFGWFLAICLKLANNQQLEWSLPEFKKSLPTSDISDLYKPKLDSINVMLKLWQELEQIKAVTAWNVNNDKYAIFKTKIGISQLLMKIETWGFLHCTQYRWEYLLEVENEKFKGITHTCSHTHQGY